MALRLRSVVTTLLGISIAIWLGLYLYANAPRYVPLLQISVGAVLAMVVLAFTVPVLNGLINVVLFRSLGARLSNAEGFHLAAAATLANQLPIPGGLIARGVYLRQKHGVTYPGYLSAALALFACSVAANGFIGVAILLYSKFHDRTSVSPSLLVAFAAMAACSLLFVIPFHGFIRTGRLGTWISRAVQGWNLISRSPGVLLKLLLLQTCLMLLFALRLWIAFRMLSQPIAPGHAILLACGSVLTQIISFAPGGLGIREAIVGAIATALGFDLTISIAAVGLDRIVATSMFVLIGWISTVALGREVAAARE